MFVSYLAKPAAPVLERRDGDMTMRDYYEAFRVDGRAVLEGTTKRPLQWLARVDRRLFLCKAHAIKVWPVGDDERVPAFAKYDRPDPVMVH